MPFTPEYSPQIPINKQVLETLELNAARRLVNFELLTNLSLGLFYGNMTVAERLIFPGDATEMTETMKHKFRLDVSLLIQKSTGSKRNPSNLERLAGLEKVEISN